jgi:hypothetical protein
MEVFSCLFNLDGRAFERINSAYTVLIPKKPGACEPSDFRPISLVQSLAKIFSKVLARRLGPVLPNLVGNNQVAFLKGRSLHENFKLVKESAKMLRRKKSESLLLKLDIAKAFDTMAWQFVVEILIKKGFGIRWLAWISMILSTASSSILLNGIPGPKIWHARGLQQGDALSPMLFFFVMEDLNLLLIKAEESEMLSYFPNGVELPQRMSIYADDVIIFLKASMSDAVAIKLLVDIFGEASGLKCNMRKSSISPVFEEMILFRRLA